MGKEMKKYNGADCFKHTLLTIACCLVAMLVASCNKNFDGVVTTKYNNDSAAVSAGNKKVLYLILDGVRGTVLLNMKPANIIKINKNAVYSFYGLNDSTNIKVTNAGSWANMVTGAPINAHKVVSEDFVGHNLAEFPSIFTRLKQVRPNLKTISLAAATSFDKNLAGDASEHLVFGSDADVQEALRDKITNSNADLILAEFNSADAAGKSGGYNTDNTSYTQAITTLDGYLGEVLATLKARKTYADENWLVVIASNKGGNDPTASTTDATLFGDPVKNTYVALYNPSFEAKPYTKPNTTELAYTGKAPRFVSNNSSSVYATLTNTEIGNFGSSGDYTVMFKIRDDYGSPSFYPMFFGKRNPFNSTSSTGWSCLFANNSAQFDWNGSPRPSFGVNIRDAQWHTVAFTTSTIAGKRTFTMFVDGAKRNSAEISSNPDNTVPLRIGADSGSGSNQGNFLLTDLAIFNVAIPDNELITLMKREVNEGHPYFTELLGWWPCNEGFGKVLKDRSGKDNDFTINGNVEWSTYNDLSPNINASISGAAYRTVPNGVDLPFTIYNWLNVLPPATWGLSGHSLSPNYSSLSTN